MRRRDFPLALAAVPLAAQTRKVKAAFLGAAHSHAPDKLKLVMAHPRYEFAGVWEENEKVRASLTPLKPVFRAKRQLLEDPSIEVLFIESEVATHANLALEAVNAGKHVHVEKPPSDSMGIFRKICAVAETRKLHLQTGYMWRFNPAVVQACDAARSGTLGDIYHIHARMNTLIGEDRRPEWNLFRGGQMFEQGAHLIDIVVRLMGMPKSVTPFLRHDGPFNDTLKDNTVAVLSYDRCVAVIAASVLQPNASAHRTLEIFGAKGNAVVRPIEPPSLEIDIAGQPKRKPALPPYQRYTGDIDEMAAAILDGRPLSVSLQQELQVHEVLLTASQM